MAIGIKSNRRAKVSFTPTYGEGMQTENMQMFRNVQDSKSG